MKKDGLLTGLVLGGLMGITISLLAVNAAKSGKGKEEDNIQEKDKKKMDIPQVQEIKQETNGYSEKPPQNSEETAEKTENKEEETRNTEQEIKKKAEKEGISFGEDITSKLNFSKKIAQLEESLKKLREENV